MFSNTGYTILGDELTQVEDNPINAILYESEIYVDGNLVTLATYNINNSNYFKLTDIMQILDIYISQDEDSNLIILDTSRSYES